MALRVPATAVRSPVEACPAVPKPPACAAALTVRATLSVLPVNVSVPLLFATVMPVPLRRVERDAATAPAVAPAAMSKEIGVVLFAPDASEMTMRVPPTPGGW